MAAPKRARQPLGSVAVDVSVQALQLNALLAGLEPEALEALKDRVTLVDVPVREQIYRADERIDEVYFPIDCVLSVVTRMSDGHMIEVGTIGREGVSSIPLLFGATTSANECYCQVPGQAIRMKAAIFSPLMRNARFRAFLDRYVQAYVNMLGQLAACNRLHTIYERCARWLLMTQDRVGEDKIRLTHEYLAMMLGTERSGVSIATGILQNAGFIRSGHGVISILDRSGLENSACECYEVARKQFGGLLLAAENARIL